MTIKKIIRKLHLWLGLASGLVVFIIGFTGCLIVFEKEIRHVTEPYQYTGIQNKPFLEPSKLKAIAEKQLDGKMAVQVQYPGKGKSAIIAHYDQNSYMLVYLNPYTGQVLMVKNMRHDFFRIMLTGHYSLWMPGVGEYIVSSATLIFILLLISGLVLWWPRRWNQTTRRGTFTISLRSRYKTINYHLHNVLGFYVLLFSMVIALTGLVWGFQWFSKSSYWLTSGGKQLPGWETPHSGFMTQDSMGSKLPVDLVWCKIYPEYVNKPGIFSIDFPHDSIGVITINYNPDAGTYYRAEVHYFDQYKLVELQGKSLFAEQYHQSSAANKLRRMNYDIHTGAILGLTGKLLVFFASLIAASLPVTGVLIWLFKPKR